MRRHTDLDAEFHTKMTPNAEGCPKSRREDLWGHDKCPLRK